MPRLPWDAAQLDALDADGWQTRATKRIDSVLAPYAPPQPMVPEPQQPAIAPTPSPEPVATPSLSFNLGDWSPWNNTPAVAQQQPAQSGNTPSSFDDPGWFPWSTGKSVAMPTAPRTVDATITTGPRPGQSLQPGESVGSVTLADTDDDEQYIRQAAIRRGIDPDMAVRVANTEGGANAGGRARQNLQGAPAYSHFQLYIGGPGMPAMGDEALAAGIDPRDPKQWKQAVDFALDRALERGWQPFQGAAAAGIGDWDGIRGQAAPQSRTPMPAEQTPQAQQQGAWSAGSYTPNQINAATAEGLDYETALAVCGPAAAIAFARKTGRNPTMQEAVGLAREVGWTPDAGMAGPASQQRLLQRMGVASRLTEGSPDWQSVAADVQRGNPVTISTPGHYFVAERYDPESGAFDFGESAAVLKASGGRRWFRPEELVNLGMGEARAVLFIDNPESPTPSIAADPRQSLNAGAGSPQPAPAPSPQATAGVPPTSGSPERAMWSPDDMPADGQQMAYQAATGRSGGSGVMYRGFGANMPEEVGNEQPEPSYADPTISDSAYTAPAAGVSYGPPLSEAGPEVNTREVPGNYPEVPGSSSGNPSGYPGSTREVPGYSYTIADGRTEPPTPQGDWQSVETVPAPSAVPYGPPLSEAGPEQTAEQRIQSTTAPAGRIAAPQTPVGPEVPPAPAYAPRAMPEQASAAPVERPSFDPLAALEQYGEPGRKLAAELRRAYRDPSQGINPWTVYEALQAIPFEVVSRARRELIPDAEAKREAGTDPVAPFRDAAAALGLPLPSPEELNPEGRPASDIGITAGLTAVAPDPFDPAAGLALNTAGRAIGSGVRGVGAAGRAIGNAVAPIVDDAVEGARAAGRAALQAGGDAPVPSSLGSGFLPNAFDEMRTSVRAGAGDIEQRAVQQFGTTENIGSMGYVLRDGTGLDFSGGGGGGRGMDHRSITSVIDGPTGTSGMQQFMGDTGAVRVSMNSGGQLSLDIPNGLSPQQRRLLMDEARYAESVYLDIMDPATGERISSQQFSLPMDRGKLNQTIRQIPDHVVEPSEAARAAETAAKVEAAEILRSRIQFARDTLAGKFGAVDETARAYYAQSFKADQAKLRAIESGKSAGSGFIRSMSDIRNAAQGGVIGAASELTSDEELTPQERLARMGIGAGLGVAAGRRAGRQPGRRLGSGFVADSGPTPRSRMNMEDIAARAEEVLGVKPEQVRAWQQETLAEPAYGRAVRGSALQQAARVDEDAAMRAIERLETAQNTARGAREIDSMGATERLEVADAALEAAEAALAMRGSKAASTAEGRATARALAQRRQAIVARTAVESAERAKQVGQEAAFAAREAQRAARTGTVSPQAEQRLRTVADKLRDPEANGLVSDGAGGRLEAMEQQAETARTAAQTPASARTEPQRTGMRSEASRYEPGIGTRVAGEVGSILASTGGGAVIGAAANPEDPATGARYGAAVGALGAFGARRLAPRLRGNRTLGLLGPMPTTEMPNRAIALAPDGKQYTFAYRVVDLDDLVTSNTPTGTVNPAYPAELQPRDRTRAASQVQVDNIVQRFNPTELLHDGGRLDAGPMIVGPDRAVESGNGRTMALRRLAQERPEEYARYVDMMRANLSEYGLDEKALAGKRTPVLVRERLTDVDRPAFAATANGRVSAGMSPVEQARQAAASLSDEVVGNLTIGDGDTIATALRRADNQDLVQSWVNAMPENDRANILDQNGQISTQGYQQLADTLLVRTYGEGAGVRAFIEAADPEVRNVQVAVMASLPDMARAEALIRSGQRDASLSLAGDVAAATEVLARLKRDRMSVKDYVRQIAMGDRELSPFQEELLQFLDQNQRRPGAIREALREYAAAVENAADPNQMDMFGGAVASVTKEDAWSGATSGIRRERDARVAQQRAKLQAENAARTPAADIVPATGGPEGRLEIEGAPQPTPRPGPTGGMGDPVTGARLTADGQVPLEPTPRPGPTGGAGEAVTDARLANNGQLPLEPTARPGAVDSAPATGGPDGTLTLASGRTIKDVVSQIDEVLKNPQAAGSVERLQQLHQDLQEISTAGFTRSSDIRKRLQRNGLLRAGLASKTEDVDGLVRAISRTDPNKPEEIRAVLQIISKPRLIDKLLEYQYVNMLSSPITQAVNISSNAMQIAGRLFLQNPMEFVYSGGKSTGVGAAIQGTARGFREGIGEAGQIMRTGVSSKNIERAIEIGDYGHINREALTEQFGLAGAALHFVSTRPLAAMDALLGHMAYAGAAEQYAQRTADRLLKSKSPTVKGMSREQARQHVLSNIWDYPEIIEKAGNIQEYTLLRSRDTEGNGWGKIERGLRMMASARNPAEDAGAGGQIIAFLANQVLPFFNVPLNFAKQGVERTVGVPVNAVRAGQAFRAGNVERGAELAAKASIGAGAITTAAMLALGDNLTGDGPSDSGQRKVWEETHKRNSFRVPGTSQWISWEGTPFAIPFGMMAGAKEAVKESTDRATKKGQTDPLDMALSTAGGVGTGLVSGFASQSFIKSLGQQYQLLTGDQTGLGTVAASATGTASRFIPFGSMANWMARVTDSMERDAGKPQTPSEVPQNVADRLKTRIPGARQTVDPKLDMYGEPAPNEQSGLPGVLPYYRGQGARANDPITQRVEAAGVGAPEVPNEIPAGGTEGTPIPLNTREKRAFQQAWGQAYRRLLEQGSNGQQLSPQAIEKLRSTARGAGIAAALREMGTAERQKRVQDAVKRKVS